jgi:hypothetical protein
VICALLCFIFPVRTTQENKNKNSETIILSSMKIYQKILKNKTKEIIKDNIKNKRIEIKKNKNDNIS